MKKRSTGKFFLLSLIVLACFAITSRTQNEITLKSTPKELFEKMINNPEFAENARGENFCWHAASGMDGFIDNFQLTKNIKWLDAGTTYYDFLIGRMDTDPDGLIRTNMMENTGRMLLWVTPFSHQEFSIFAFLYWKMIP